MRIAGLFFLLLLIALYHVYMNKCINIIEKRVNSSCTNSTGNERHAFDFKVKYYCLQFSINNKLYTQCNVYLISLHSHYV